MFRLHPGMEDTLYKYQYTDSTTFYNRGFKIQYIAYQESCPGCGKPATWISLYLYEVPSTRTIYISCPTVKCQKLDMANKRAYYDFIGASNVTQEVMHVPMTNEEGDTTLEVTIGPEPEPAY